MKNPAIASATVLVALALAIGGFAWMAAGTEPAQGGAEVLTRTEGEEVSFLQISPREQRKRNNLEQAKRELHRIRQTGKEVQPGVFKIEDETGDPTYYVGDLIPGKGRDGEPMFLSVQFKKMPAPPLKQRKQAPTKFNKLDPKRHDDVLKMGDVTAADGTKPGGNTGPDAGAGAGTGTGSTGGSSGGSGSGGDSGGGSSSGPQGGAAPK